MLNRWLLLSFVCVGTTNWHPTVAVETTAINDGETTLSYPIPFSNVAYFQLTNSKEPAEDYNNSPNFEKYDESFQREDFGPRMFKPTPEGARRKRWLISPDDHKPMYLQSDKVEIPSNMYLQSIVDNTVDNQTDSDVIKNDKRSFSPWGGKRDNPGKDSDQTWAWKRATSWESSMPKRVRFSPWGGKRTDQSTYKPMPYNMRPYVQEYARPVGKDLRLPYETTTIYDKKHLHNLNFKMDDRFKEFVTAFQKIVRENGPYSENNFKKDGKRKMKFSAWGGKRSPSMIRPGWSNLQDGRDEILLVDGSEFKANRDPTKAFN